MEPVLCGERHLGRRVRLAQQHAVAREVPPPCVVGGPRKEEKRATQARHKPDDEGARHEVVWRWQCEGDLAAFAPQQQRREGIIATLDAVAVPHLHDAAVVPLAGANAQLHDVRPVPRLRRGRGRAVWVGGGHESGRGVRYGCAVALAGRGGGVGQLERAIAACDRFV